MNTNKIIRVDSRLRNKRGQTALSTDEGWSKVEGVRAGTEWSVPFLLLAGFVDDLVAVVILFEERLIARLIPNVNSEERQRVRIDNLVRFFRRQIRHVLIGRGVYALPMADSVAVFGIILIHAGKRVMACVLDLT